MIRADQNSLQKVSLSNRRFPLFSLLFTNQAAEVEADSHPVGADSHPVEVGASRPAEADFRVAEIVAVRLAAEDSAVDEAQDVAVRSAAVPAEVVAVSSRNASPTKICNRRYFWTFQFDRIISARLPCDHLI